MSVCLCKCIYVNYIRNTLFSSYPLVVFLYASQTWPALLKSQAPLKSLKFKLITHRGLSPDAYAIFPERAGAQWLLCCPMCPRGMCTSQWQPHPYIESPRMSRLLRHAQLVCDRFRFLEGHWKKGSGKSLPRQATSASGRAHCITLQQQSDTSSPSLNTKLSPYVGKGK